MIAFFQTLVTVLQLALVPMCICAICFAIDTYIQLRYFIWECKKRKECEEIEIEE